MLRSYEGLFIIDSGLNEDERKKVVESIGQVLTKNGGVIRNTKSEGMKVLAYPIKKKTEGFYELVSFEAEPSALSPVKKAYSLNEKILRYVITKVE